MNTKFYDECVETWGFKWGPEHYKMAMDRCQNEECKKTGCKGPRLVTHKVSMFDVPLGNEQRNGFTVLTCLNERRG